MLYTVLPAALIDEHKFIFNYKFRTSARVYMYIYMFDMHAVNMRRHVSKNILYEKVGGVKSSETRVELGSGHAPA